MPEKELPMKADFHLHSSFSADSDTPMRQMVEKGISLGLSVMCFTEHMDYDYKDEGMLFETDMPAYFRTFQSAITREINHGTSKRDVLAMAEKECDGELYRQLRNHLNSKSKMAKLLYAPLANGNFAKAYVRGRLICFVQKHFAGLFAKLKQHR